MVAPVTPVIPIGAITSTNQAKVRYDQDFQQRVEILASKYALQVMAEDASTDNHAARVTYARLFLGAPTLITDSQVTCAVVADLLTASTVTEDDLLTRIAAVWNALAGIG